MHDDAYAGILVGVCIMSVLHRGGGGGGRGRPRSSKGVEGGEIEAQEMPDDIYEGEQDDALRPAKPGQVGSVVLSHTEHSMSNL
jgi:hypothetical protein